MIRALPVLACAALAAAPALVAASAPVEPRIVLQVTDGFPEIAAWSADETLLFTARAANRELLVWDATSGDIVNRIVLPRLGGDYAELRALTVGPDHRTATLEAAAMPDGGPCRAVRVIVDLTEGSTTTETGAAATCTTQTAFVSEPVSPLSGWRLQRGDQAVAAGLLPAGTRDGLYAFTAAGALVQRFAKPPPLTLHAADMAADGRRVAVLQTALDGRSTRLEVRDLASGAPGAGATFGGAYRAMKWADGDTLLLGSGRMASEREVVSLLAPSTDEIAAPDRLVAAASGAVLRDLPQRCFTAALGGGRFVGAGLLGETRTPAAIQQPALFDFTGSASPVTLAAAP